MFENRYTKFLKTIGNISVSHQSDVDVGETETEERIPIISNELHNYHESEEPAFDKDFDMINVASISAANSKLISDTTNQSKNRTVIKTVQVQFLLLNS